MTWVRLDEEFPDHPKVAAAGPLASWLHVCALAYCNRFLTDGFVPSAQLPRLADFSGIYVDVTKFGVDTPNPHSLAGQLVEVGMWLTAPGGYQIHDFHDFQPSKAEVIAQRKSKSEAGKKGAASRWGADGRNGTTNGTSHSTSYGKTMAERCPVPVSVPVGNKSSSARSPQGAVENVADAEASSEDDDALTEEELAVDAFWIAHEAETWRAVAQLRFERAIARGHTILKPAAWMRKTTEGLMVEHGNEYHRMLNTYDGIGPQEVAAVLEGGTAPARYRVTPSPEVGPGPTDAGRAAMRAAREGRAS